MTACLGLRDRVLCSTQVDPALGIVEVGQLAIFVDENGHLSEEMRTTEVTILLLHFHVQFEAGTAEELEAFDSGKSVPIEGQKGETELQDHVLHGEIRREEHYVHR